MPTASKASNVSAVAEKLTQIRQMTDECIKELVTVGKARRAAPRSSSSVGLRRADGALNYDAHKRAFVRAHCRGLSGGQKFVLLLSYIAKGRSGSDVPLKDVERMWNRMTSLLKGKFNRKYTNDAKERGWVNTKKTGVYVLSNSWKDIFR